MATNGVPNGVPNGEKRTRSYDPNFTQAVIDATGPKAVPRLKQVLPSLIQHLHDFCRENEITIPEFMAAVELLNEAGRWSDDRRNEGQLLWDILGLESLVDEITYKVATDGKDDATASAVLGPFWRKDAPRRKMGETIVFGIKEADFTLMHGKVVDHATGAPIEGAELDVWHTGPNGLYEQQDPNQPDYNLRGRFTTGKEGKYDFICLRPTSYPIPFDGPSGKLLKLLDRHPMRPAHIHFIITAPGYKPIVTQIFDRRDPHISNDVAFAVKDSLTVDFLPLQDNPKAQFELAYDFKLVASGKEKENEAEGATAPSTAGDAAVGHA